MKSGLTYIHERTNQLRYSDRNEFEQWLQQLSTYIPIQEIKRGQPVSIATDEDLKLIAKDDDELYNALLNSSDSYIVLTNPSRHLNTIGLSLEYTRGEVSLEGDSLKTPEKIHILGQGQYIEDKDYYANAFTNRDNVDVSNEEYWPSFFNDYKNSIGKKVYVKGSTSGELTIVKEESYLAHNNVIVVGFVTDAKISGVENDLNVGAIEVQVQGDDRGIIDATTFEAVIGEDVYIGKNVVQSNGEKNSKTKVFALGAEDDCFFSFSFNYNALVNTVLPRGFIAIQRWDGKTAYIYTNGEIDKNIILNNENFDYNDRAFWQVAQYYAVNSTEEGDKIAKFDLAAEKADALNLTLLQNYLKQAMTFVSPGKNRSLKTGVESEITDLIITQKGTYRFECTANAVGGYFDIYVSSNITKFFSDLNVASHGSYYNKGYAVLADIRNPLRQNIIGIYNSGHEGLIKKLENAIFVKQGLFVDSTRPYEVGQRYYLGSHGNIFKVPQEYYNSIISIGYAQTDERLIVDCCDSRQYNNGDLPVGYMKPSIKGEAEFGFWLMDGKTPHKISDGSTLYQRLLNYYDKSELKISTYNFGTDEAPDYAEGFIIPAVSYQKNFENDESNYVAAQIKWLAEGVYKEMPRTPFVRRVVTIEGDETQSRLPDIDITPLMIYGPQEDRIQVPDLESLNIKLFVDLSDGENEEIRNWTQIEPGFHQYDNYSYYGFKWSVLRVEEPSINHPYGTWILRAVYTGTGDSESPNKYVTSLGLCYLADPFSPPVPLHDRKAKVFVTKQDYYSRQFDVESLFKDYVKESIVDASGNPWKNNAVSGQAIRDDIYSKVLTKHLVFGSAPNTLDPTYSTLEGYLSKINLTIENVQNENGLINRRLLGPIRFANTENTDSTHPFIDYYNGLFKFYYENEDDVNKGNNKIALKNRILNEEYALMPSFIYKEHKELSVDTGPSVEYPHGIKNLGWDGNLNAKKLQNANLGYPQHLFSANASEADSLEYEITTNDSVRITIPFTQKLSSGEYLTRLGNEIEFWDNEKVLKTESQNDDDFSGCVTDVIDVLENKNYINKISGSYNNNKKNIYIEYNFGDEGTDHDIRYYIENDGNPANIYAKVDTPSSIKLKYAYKRFETNATPLALPQNYEHKFLEDDSNLNEALQAIYEMPLATFKYNREKDNEYYKKYFGIIVERIAQTVENVNDTPSLTGSTSFDHVNFEYSDSERKSISEYLSLMTDNNNEGMRVSSAVGILLKAAKETQERLLNLEVATYGKDSPTLPGSDAKNPNYNDVTQNSTIAGLNRLVKALCREVFQDSDPVNIDEEGAWSEGSDNYSRLDLLDKQINGEKAVQDSGEKDRIPLSIELGETYPDKVETSESYSHDHKVVADSPENDNDFGSADAVKYPYNFTFDNDGTTDEDFEDGKNFDGLNDAVNRITLKINKLTEHIIGEDDIKLRPRKLDYIRLSLETILRELYSGNTEVTDLEEEPFEKTSLSRIDKILQKLFNYSLKYKTGQTQKDFNNKLIKGEEIENDDGEITQINSKSPETIDAITNNASILDVIVDTLATKEEYLVRTDRSNKYEDLEKNVDGWKVKENVIANDYSNMDYVTPNILYYRSYSVLHRLKELEKFSQLVYSRLANKVKFNEDATRIGPGAYSGVTSIDDYFKNISNNSGFTFETNGIYSNNRKLEDGTYKRDNKSISAESWKDYLSGPVSGKSSNLYDVIYDIIKRVKNLEHNVTDTNYILGVDYDDYLDSQKTKDDYESLQPDVALDTSPKDNKVYTITSNIRAILKLLYGADITPDDSDNQTTYDNFEVADERNDNFTKSPANNGVSVIDSLYRMLYTIKTPHKREDDGTITALNGSFTVDSLAHEKNIIGYDPASDSSISCRTETSPVGDGNRRLFINQQKDDGSKFLNRIDILEDWVKSIYNFIGFGNATDSGYFDGSLNITHGEKAEDSSSLCGSPLDVRKVLINSSDGNVNVYKDLNLIADDQQRASFKLSKIALQGYYNTLDIKRLLGDNTNSGWIYNKPDTSIFEGTPKKIFTINEIINELLGYINTIDTEICNIKDSQTTGIISSSNSDYDKETVVIHDLSFKEDVDKNKNKLVSVESAQTDYSSLLSEMQRQMMAYTEEEGQRCLLKSYLICNDIECVRYEDSYYIKVTKTDTNITYYNNNSSADGSISVDKESISKRYGGEQDFIKITVEDFIDNVEFSCYVKLTETETSESITKSIDYIHPKDKLLSFTFNNGMI